MTGNPIAATVFHAMDDHGEQGQPPRTPAASDEMNQGMRVLSSLIAGVLVYGALGWLGDHFLGTRFLLPIGIVLGAAFGSYVTIKRLSASLKPASAGTGRPLVTGTSANDTREGER